MDFYLFSVLSCSKYKLNSALWPSSFDSPGGDNLPGFEEQPMPTWMNTTTNQNRTTEKPSSGWKTFYLASDHELSLLKTQLSHYFYSQMRSCHFYWLECVQNLSWRIQCCICGKINPRLKISVPLAAQLLTQVTSTLSVRSNRGKTAHFPLTYGNKKSHSLTQLCSTLKYHTLCGGMWFYAMLLFRTSHILKFSVPKQN